MPSQPGNNLQNPDSLDELRLCEAELRAIFDLSPVGMAQVSAKTGKFIRVNGKYCEWTGYSAEELAKMSPADITYVDDVAADNDMHQRLLRGEISSQDREKRYLRKDGTVIWVHVNATLLRDTDGQPDRTMAVIQDITQRRADEQALEESGRQFLQIVMNVAVPTMLHADDGTVALVNHMWTHLTGYRVEDIPTITDWTQKAYGEQHVVADDYIDKLFETETRLDNGEWTVTTATGAKRVWHFSSTPLGREPDGRRLMISSAVDVTEQNHANQALRQSQQFTRSVLDNLYAFVGVLTPDGTLIEANRAPLEAAGISSSEVIGKKFWDCYWWSYSTDVQAQWQDWCHKAALGETIRADVQACLAGGALVWLDIQLAPLRDAQGRITHLIPSGIDVSGRRHTEETLRTNEERYRTLFESMDQGYCVVEMIFDESGAPVDYRFVEVNPAFERHTGLAGATGQTMLALVPDIETHWFDVYGQVATTGVPVRFVDQSRAMQGRWFDVFAFRLGEADSHKLAILFDDVSTQKGAEQKLIESEERLRMATSAVSDVVWTNSADGQMQGEQVSWGEFTGQSRAEYEGRGWAKAVHPDDVQQTIDAWNSAVAGNRAFSCEHRVCRYDGQWRLCSVRALPVKNPDGTIREWVGVHADITERKRDEEKLRQLAAELSEADHRKNEFLATLAHELRNPLAPIRNGLQLMKLAGGQHEAIDQARAMMERQLTHMVRLVDDLMDASRISQGKLELRKQPISLTAVLNSAIEASSAMVESRKHQLIVDLPAHTLMVDADLTRLAQVFQNLLNNAAKYSEPGGQIHVTVKSHGGEARVTIKDSGVGIATAQLPRIFEMFTQVDRSLEMSQGGLGIGLSLVQRLVNMHGGTVEATSAGLGQGSEFVVHLPLLNEWTQPIAPDSHDKPAASSMPLKILVVDDNRDGADSLSEMLQLMGNDTRTGYDGLQAVALAGAYQPDVILLDIGLPKLNGYEACGLIRENAAGKPLVLIAVTGWGQDKDRDRTRAAGFDHHLVKPVDPMALMKMLDGLSLQHPQKVDD